MLRARTLTFLFLHRSHPVFDLRCGLRGIIVIGLCVSVPLRNPFNRAWSGLTQGAAIGTIKEPYGMKYRTDICSARTGYVVLLFLCFSHRQRTRNNLNSPRRLRQSSEPNTNARPGKGAFSCKIKSRKQPISACRGRRPFE